jgi:hypothetical protein
MRAFTFSLMLRNRRKEMQDTWHSEDADVNSVTIKDTNTPSLREKKDFGEAIHQVADPKISTSADLPAFNPWRDDIHNDLTEGQAFQVKQVQVIIGTQVHRS